MFDAIAANNTSFSGGFIEHRSERYTVRGTGLVRGVDDIRGIVVDEVDGVPVLVSTWPTSASAPCRARVP